MKYPLFLIALTLFLSPVVSKAAAADWSAFSVIEKQADGKAFKETVFLVNASAKVITLKFPNFQFPGHDDTPATSIGPMGNVVLAPGESVSFIHIIPIDRKNGFATSIGIQDVQENIEIKQVTVKETYGHG